MRQQNWPRRFAGMRIIAAGWVLRCLMRSPQRWNFFNITRTSVHTSEANPRYADSGSSDFPYQIVYQISPDEILIIAFAHAKRRPGYWRPRPRRNDSPSE